MWGPRAARAGARSCTHRHVRARSTGAYPLLWAGYAPFPSPVPHTARCRCGELRVGAYFACSGVSFYEDQCWMKIRRGYFSNARSNGYVRVELDAAGAGRGDLPARQQTSEATRNPAQFKFLRRLPGPYASLVAAERRTWS